MELCVKAEHLAGGYEGKTVFQDFELAVPKGAIVTLIGANGSGKSTILKTISRLLAPKGGSILLEGQAISQMSSKEIARKIAILPQDTKCPRGIKVRELAEYGRYPYRKALGRYTEEDHKIVDWALTCTGMTELSDQDVDQLSGGQRQRAWIAMALAQKTGILFLDEPTTYLDIAHQLEILKLLRKLNLEQHVTVVMVLHDLNHAIMFSDYLVAIKDGRTLYEGKPSEVVTPGMLRSVFGIEAEIIEHPILHIPFCLPYDLL